MTARSQQLNALTEEISKLLMQRENLIDELRRTREHLTCKKVTPEFPLETHGPTEYCPTCFESMRVEHARATIVLGSIRMLIQGRMRLGHQCPFCGQMKKHSETCYLDNQTGQKLLEEYSAIEMHRDMLLAEQLRMNAPSKPAPTVRVGLKTRFLRSAPKG